MESCGRRLCQRIVIEMQEEDNKRVELEDIKNQSYFTYKMNRSFVVVVSWYKFKLIWLHRSLVSKTVKRKIKLTPTGAVEKQDTQAVATAHNITINNKLNLHYL